MKQKDFAPVKSQVSFPAVEEEILSFWKKHDTFKASLDKTGQNDAFVFYDGPPFATGLPHYGHLLAGTIKDIIPRYWTMRGRYVARRFGWDCHGLPVENEVEKAHGISKHGIENVWGIELFNEICRSIVLRYTAQWRTVVERMGRWVDFENQYRTMDPSYMESIWAVFKQVWDKDLIYQGFRVQPYCPRCATPLSNFEMNEGYKDVQTPSITVYFPLVNDPATKLLVWTTTPWTLPSNVACAVGPTIPYLKVKDGDSNYIIAKDRIAAYYKDPSQYTIAGELQGTQLEGLRYTPLFDYFAKTSDKFFTVTCADFVSTEDGTGIVHIAPAFGEDDFCVGKKLGLPVVCPVDEEGKFTAEVPEYRGKLVFDADSDIMKRIKAMGRLVHRSTFEHRYPHCYRCDSPLIYKAITTWFMKIEPLKKNMLENNQAIHWVPSHLQNGRFGKGIESAPDWNISRNRYWGTPIPVWSCDCGHRECVGSLQQLHELVGDRDARVGEGYHGRAIEDVKRDATDKFNEFKNPSSPAWQEIKEFADIPKYDLHRHVIDRLQMKCPKCHETMQRTPEVLDCWFESGSMPYAQIHYMFTGDAAEKRLFDACFPADFIAEGLDQTRGWFYTLTVLSSALFKKEAFKNVIVNGIILSEDGKKLSKRLKNYAPPEEILKSLGADALRLFLINSPAVKAEDLRFSEKGVTEMSRAILLPYWNAYSFFVTYAMVDGWKPSTVEPPQDGTELDFWIVSLLNDTIDCVNREMEEYNLYKVVPLLIDFIDNLTNWYIRRSRRRFWKSENDKDKDVAYRTLYYVLVEFVKVMAPFLPFLTEAIYRNLVVGKLAGAAESVHLSSYPIARTGLIVENLELTMRLVREAVVMGRALRSKYTIKTRQPLSECTVIMRDINKIALLKKSESLIREELNVKKVTFDTNEEHVVSISAKANFKRLGKIFGPKMKEVAAIIEKFTPDQIKSLEPSLTTGVSAPLLPIKDTRNDILSELEEIAASPNPSRQGFIEVLGKKIWFDDIEIRRTKHEHIEVETGNEMTVALDTTITPELKNEGLAREFVNRVQNLRKDSGFEVADRIRILFESDSNELNKALAQFSDYIKSETLATNLSSGKASKDMKSEECEIEDIRITVGIKKASNFIGG
ncbi:MAG: isoleucine--tRNA ligase [Chitinispirillaceae bacterium]|jgi:isoleucyl-tRNA synthetase